MNKQQISIDDLLLEINSKRIDEEQLQIILNKTIPNFGFLSNTLASELLIYEDYIDAVWFNEDDTKQSYVLKCLNGVTEKQSQYEIPHVKLKDAISFCNILNLDYIVDGKIFNKSIAARNDLEKINFSQIKIIQKHKNAIGMILEKQMIDFLLNGKIYTESYTESWLANENSIDFMRASSLQNVVFSQENKWNYLSGSVEKSLLLAKNILAEQGMMLAGVIADYVTMKHIHIEHQRMGYCPSNTLNNEPRHFTFSGCVSTFTDGNITYYEYDEPLDLSRGTTAYKPFQKLIPTGTAIFIGKNGSGQVPIKKIYGQIKDIDNIKNGTYEQKIYIDGEKIITKAAPLIWGNANCAFSANVLL